ncbi:AbrB/MazE/SpoVT family DNA-binding domain-containing protein [Bdellovibrionota bacterium FG-1]
MTVKVSPKYQVVIPEAVRTALGIRAGSQIEVIAKGKVAYLVPVQTIEELQSEMASRLNHKNLREKKDRAS